MHIWSMLMLMLLGGTACSGSDDDSKEQGGGNTETTENITITPQTLSYPNNGGTAEFTVLYGTVELGKLGLPNAGDIRKLTLNAEDIPFDTDNAAVCFDCRALSENSKIVAQY